MMENQVNIVREEALHSLLAAFGGKGRLMDELLRKEQAYGNPVSEEQLLRLADHLCSIVQVSALENLVGPHVTEV
ncbi:MAG: hypothetical protein K2J86_09470, partial [Prevotella sp.]|nr:hypothetical protein [Prevotella sp.]